MAGVLHGLHAAHDAKSDRGQPLGLVHRDVSPHIVQVGAAIVFTLERRTPTAREATSTTATSPEVPASAAPSSSTTLDSPSASAAAMISADSAVSASTASTASPKTPRRGGPRVPVASATAAHTAQPAAQCDPPYYFNSQGARVFKPECL
jgi:hypothetical protein